MHARLHQTAQTYSVIICGGLNATGTNIIGPFVYEKWDDKISGQKFDNNAKVIDSDNFYIIYKANGQKDVRLDSNATIDSRPIFIRQF